MMKYFLIIKKMNNLPKNLLYLFIILIALGACQNVRDGLTGKKKGNSDEFLVKKKNPLVLPPEFEKLPMPQSLSEKNKKEEEIDFKVLPDKGVTSIKTDISIKRTNGPLEKIIMEKIKNN